ncbi:lytic transglycosylase domain-containing protein [Ideonella sp. A 288]|uniref:lytic transglycosylase domain-containing protein n=1 Tax=Ideonella sp. A 288 TaxID=1962181 RepID=UPI000B4A8A39|nr:lytic transglycosylase domain-containing protein [Ideonella sp. A 288]
MPGPTFPIARVTLSGIGLALGLAVAPIPLTAQVPTAPAVAAADATILDAREAARRRDRSRLAAARATAQAARHPLAPWVDYWDLTSRLSEVQVEEVESFYTRWPGSYVEDRLRNDWLLELGKRRDFGNLARDYPRFRMNDDREVSCWWLLTEHLAGRDVLEPARAAWWAQREADDGCNMLATALFDAKRFTVDDVWRKARFAVEANRPGAARQAIGLLGIAQAKDAAEALDQPARFVHRTAESGSRARQELRLLALMRLAASDVDAAASELDARGRSALPAAMAAWGWAAVGRQAAMKLSPDAASHYHRAWSLLPTGEAHQPGWSDDTLAWGARAALRVTRPSDRWPLVLRHTQAMSALQQADPTWVYWRARALRALAKDGPAGDDQRAEARRALESIAGPLGFYNQLAAEDLGQPLVLPPPAATPNPTERDAARQTPGLSRALHLANLGLRDEARREWNFTLRGMSDRELISAARLACEVSDWQLCINTSERSKLEVDVATRYPTPFAAEINQAARAAGLEPAYVFGLIRQETRFMPLLRSHVGASGLMQLMPATARWVAKRAGVDLPRPDSVYDPVTNLRLGTTYLKLVQDDLGGSQALAAAAYNAGPGRPRRWREGAPVEAAAWAENVPFNETRDYVKKVLSNTAVYSALLGGQPGSLKARLGTTIGPRDVGAPPSNTELP